MFKKELDGDQMVTLSQRTKSKVIRCDTATDVSSARAAENLEGVPNLLRAFRCEETLPAVGSEETVVSDDTSTSAILTSSPSLRNYLNCVICLQLMTSPTMTKCGHTFCYACIDWNLKYSTQCPICSVNLDHSTIFPNHALENIIHLHKNASDNESNVLSKVLGVTSNSVDVTLGGDSRRDVRLREIETAVIKLQELRTKRERDQKQEHFNLLREILRKRLDQVRTEEEELRYKCNLLKRDIGWLDEFMVKDQESVVQGEEKKDLTSNMCKFFDDLMVEYFRGGHNALSFTDATSPKTSGLRPTSPPEAELSGAGDHRRDCSESSSTSMELEPGYNRMPASLQHFSHCVKSMSKYSRAEGVATVSYKQRMYVNTNYIVSSIDVNKDEEYFAVAGVAKNIKLFRYETVLHSNLQDQRGNMLPAAPDIILTHPSKLSCIQFNKIHSNVLVSGDYEGKVTLWDGLEGKKSHTFTEHHQRCWSVDVSSCDARLLVSGGDDGRVVLYDIAHSKKIATIEYRANVCCVQFSPASKYQLIFGTADHNLHYHDIRKLKTPIATFTGHSKAVSYVKFLDANHVVSASTDSSLRLWNLSTLSCENIYSGHVNEKNFVGLACNSEYVVCGSEDNKLYLYYRGFSKPLLSYEINNQARSLCEEITKTESGDFVSAVCWKEGSDIVLAGNSTGTVELIKLWQDDRDSHGATYDQE